MAFIELKEFRVVDIIQKKERISLIAKYSMDSHLIFFKDKTFQHIDRTTQAILHQAKLSFLPNKYLRSAYTNRVVVMGLAEEGGLHCAVIDVDQDYAIEVRNVENVKPESTTVYHLYESLPNNEQANEIFLIRIEQNVENGIAVAVYDFWRDLWCEQMIALSSKFLNYRLVQTSINNELYKESLDLTCHSFALISSGQKLDSINYSKIKFSHQAEGENWVLKVKFIITRELRLKKQMTIIGGQQFDSDKLLVIGNAKQDSNNAQQIRNTPAMVVINTAIIENNDLQELKIVNVDFHRDSIKSIQIRNFLGVLENNMIVMLLLPFNKIAFAKFTPHLQQIFLETQCKSANGPFNYHLSTTNDCFYRYELECEPFFEKIKKAPSKIGFHLIKIYNKQAHYEHIMKCAFHNLDSFFVKEILNLF